MNLVDDISLDSRLDDVLADYLKAQALGQGSDRQVWLDRHPDLASGLHAFFADFDHVHGVTADLRQALKPAPCRRGQRIGAYRVLDQIGAGGMGIVYLAEHAQVQRQAALKMLRAGCWATPVELQRFQGEIQAVVGLDHPYIVPIYDVGEHDSQPYFTMKWIDGGSLANWLAERGHLSTSSTALAEFIVKVCDAVHHAHQRGILHRDLKPSNILLDWNTAPSRTIHDLAAAFPYVADFGLARRLDRTDTDRGAGETLTQTGQIVGTPSYMAPEQASGLGGAPTVAADIYSLGAILYELLTGAPPFRGANPAQTLRNLMEQEPPAPRALNPAIPPDLETICLKCLDKEPGRRYPSALALADDLKAFMLGEPITARPLGRWEKLRRWRRRQPVLAALTAALAASLLVGLALTTWQWRRSEGYRRQAEQHLQDMQSERAKEEQSFRQAHQAVKDFNALLAEELEHLPGMQPLRKKSLEKAHAYFEEFLKTRHHDKDLQRELADAQLSLADLSRHIQPKHEALAQYQKALASFRELAVAHPNEEAWLLKMGLAQQNIGVLLRYTGQTAAALDAFTAAAQLYENTSFSAAGQRQAHKDLAFVQLNLGAIHGDAARWPLAFAVTRQARDLYRRMLVDEPQDRRLRADLGRCLHNLGVFHQRCDQKQDALLAFEEACAVRAELAREHPQEFDNHLAVAKHHLGGALKDVGRPADARKANQEALDLREKMVRANPKALWYRIGLASSCMTAGVEHKESGLADQALACFQRAVDLLEPMTKEDPQAVQVHLDLVRAWAHLGNELAHLKKDGEALRYFDLARARATDLTRQDGERLECRHALASALLGLASAQAARGLWDETRTVIQQALAEQKPLMDRASANGEFRRQRAKCLTLAAEANRQVGYWHDAALAARELAALAPKSADHLVQAAAELAKISTAAAQANANQEATRCAEEALEILFQARQAGLKNITRIVNQPDWEPLRRLPGFIDLAK